jgi:hypothetical protein
LWDSEVFCEAARVDVGLLEFVAECEVAVGTVWTPVAGDMVVCYYPVARFMAGYSVSDSFDCSAYLVSQNASGSELAFYFFEVCSADSAGFHPDEDVSWCEFWDWDVSDCDSLGRF